MSVLCQLVITTWGDLGVVDTSSEGVNLHFFPARGEVWPLLSEWLTYKLLIECLLSAFAALLDSFVLLLIMSADGITQNLQLLIAETVCISEVQTAIEVENHIGYIFFNIGSISFHAPQHF
jgi:hypothetical protein